MLACSHQRHVHVRTIRQARVQCEPRPSSDMCSQASARVPREDAVGMYTRSIGRIRRFCGAGWELLSLHVLHGSSGLPGFFLHFSSGLPDLFSVDAFSCSATSCRWPSTCTTPQDSTMECRCCDAGSPGSVPPPPPPPLGRTHTPVLAADEGV